MSSKEGVGSRASTAPALWQEDAAGLFADCRIFSVWEKTFVHPLRQTRGDFYVLQGASWVLCVPVLPDGRIVLVRQFRFGSQRLSWEVPGGCMDDGESAVMAAERELVEETGYVPQSIELLYQCAPNPAIMSNTCFVTLAKEVVLREDVNWDEHEELELGVFSEDEIWAMIQAGEIFHSLAVTALLYYFKIKDQS